jgi:hypothetical protein
VGSLEFHTQLTSGQNNNKHQLSPELIKPKFTNPTRDSHTHTHTHIRPEVHNTTNTHTTEITNATTKNKPNRPTKEKSTEKLLSTYRSHRKSLFNRWTTTRKKIGASTRRKSTPMLAGKNRRLSSVDPPFSDLLLSNSSPSFFVEP